MRKNPLLLSSAHVLSSLRSHFRDILQVKLAVQCHIWPRSRNFGWSLRFDETKGDNVVESYVFHAGTLILFSCYIPVLENFLIGLH